MAARAFVESQVEADQVVAATRNALAVDGDLLSADERAVIDAAVAETERCRDATDHRALVAATAALNRVTADLAARRMDRGVARALKGRRVDTLA